MATITSPGIGSGLDVNGIVSQLMQVEQQPITLLTNRETPLNAQLSDLGTLKSGLASLQDAATALSAPAKFNTGVAKFADATVGTATTTAAATVGAHSVDVTQLAQAQRLVSSAYATTASTLGSGTITIQFGSYASGTFAADPARAAQTITIPSGSSSLAGVRDAINAAGAGVTASIVNDGTGNRLVLASNTTGTASAMKVTVADGDGNNTDAGGLSALAFDASTGGTSNMTQTLPALDAKLTVDGLAIVKPSNAIGDVIDGVTLNLAGTGSTTLNVTRDTTAAVTAVQVFVQTYNNLHATIAKVSNYDPTTKQAGSLIGDPALRGIENALRTQFNRAIGRAGSTLTLAQLGITFAKDGTLSVDTTKLGSALADPTQNVAGFFTSGGTTTDSLVSFRSSTVAATPGTYGVTVTQMATQGTLTGGAAAGTTITAGVNDALTLSVDGLSRTVTLAAGSYTADTLATEVQNEVNRALAGSGASVTVAQSGGVLTLTSARYGSASSVGIAGGNGAAGLLGTAVAANGVDVAGTIGSFATTGDGRTLSGGGLAVDILGGSTGARGSLTWTDGFAAGLASTIGDLTGDGGPIASRTDGINASIKSIEQQKTALSDRMTAIEARYRAQFNALDTLVSGYNSTSTYLTQQLANLANLTKSG